ncbi:MAG: Gfo/Idh/MocA family oxidoreductase [Halieaceae bacterium]
MHKLRWGIIGAGRIAHSFARDIARVENAELVAVAARDETRARDFAGQYQARRSHGAYSELYANPEVDAVYVATPHSLHLQHSSDALRAGKAVLCEKPLVTSPRECRDLIEVAATSDAYLMEGMWTWFLPAIRQAQAWYEQGRIGDLLHVKADFGYPMTYSEDLREYDARVGGSAVLEMGIYPLAIARLFIGRGPDSWQVSGRRAANGVEDDVVAIGDYGDCMATLATGFRCKFQNWSYLIGTRGYIAIPDFWCARQCSLYELDNCVDHFDDGRDSIGFDYQIGEVSADIMAGRRQSPVIPLATSLALQEDMAAIRELIPAADTER